MRPLLPRSLAAWALVRTSSSPRRNLGESMLTCSCHSGFGILAVSSRGLERLLRGNETLAPGCSLFLFPCFYAAVILCVPQRRARSLPRLARSNF